MRVTRAGAIAAMGATITGCSHLRSALRLVGCVDGSPAQRLPPAPNAAPAISGAIVPGSRVRYTLAVPHGQDPRTITRVVYVLPGRDDRGWNALVWNGYAAVAQQLVKTGAPPFALLAIDSDASYYHPRTSGTNRLALVEQSLPSLARRLLAPTLHAEALAGQSMGGYGALLCAERQPQRYRAVAVAAPALFQSYAEANHAIGDGFDDAAQFARYDVIAHAARLAGVPVLVRVGYDDPFLTNVQAFAAACPHADVGYVEHGCHTDGFWRYSAHDLLAFCAMHLAGA